VIKPHSDSCPDHADNIPCCVKELLSRAAEYTLLVDVVTLELCSVMARYHLIMDQEDRLNKTIQLQTDET